MTIAEELGPQKWAMVLQKLDVPSVSPGAGMQVARGIDVIRQAAAKHPDLAPGLTEFAEQLNFMCLVWAHQQRLLLDRLSDGIGPERHEANTTQTEAAPP